MRIVHLLIVAIIALLSIAAGLAKIMQNPQEMEFLQGLGLSVTVITVFGVIQIVGGVLLALRKTRIFGAALVMSAFLVSTVLIFVSGNFKFGFISLVPVLLTAVIIYQTLRNKHFKS